MPYRFAEKRNDEDLASGRVLYARPGLAPFPVRLANELLLRSLQYLPADKQLSLYDPLCGSGYLLTVLGLQFPQRFARLIGSDVAEPALEVARRNLGLLTVSGRTQRKAELELLFQQFQKPSHAGALASLARLEAGLADHPAPSITCFQANLLQQDALAAADFVADLVLTDLPYGQQVAWQGADKAETAPTERLIQTLAPVLRGGSVLAVSMNKTQRIHLPQGERKEKFQVGKRRLEIWQVPLS